MQRPQTQLKGTTLARFHCDKRASECVSQRPFASSCRTVASAVLVPGLDVDDWLMRTPTVALAAPCAACSVIGVHRWMEGVRVACRGGTAATQIYPLCWI